MTTNKDALDALDELTDELEAYVAQEYQDHTYPSVKRKYDNAIKYIRDNKEKIRAALTPPVVDVEALKQSVIAICLTDYSKGFGDGWNKCIDHLHAQGYLNAKREGYVLVKVDRSKLSHMMGNGGRLYDLKDYVHWEYGDAYVTLDSEFDADFLIQLGLYMKAAQEAGKDD